MSVRDQDVGLILRDELGLDKRSGWYENDLQLAAQLGKSLLERNIDLEAQLSSSHQLCIEQTDEIRLLKRQLEVLRSVNESRQLVYEDVDRCCQELEKTNEQLNQDGRSDKETIRRLSQTVERLEIRCEELQEQLKERAKDGERQQDKKKFRQRSSSVPSMAGRQTCTAANEYRNRYNCLGYPDVFCNISHSEGTDELNRLNRSVRSLQFQLSVEQNRRKILHEELSVALSDNQSLIDRLNSVDLLSDSSASSVINSKHNCDTQLATCSKSHFSSVSCLNPDISLFGCDTECRCTRQEGRCNHKACKCTQQGLINGAGVPVDYDLEPITPSKGQLVRLKSGAMAYGSRESLRVIGIEEDDVIMDDNARHISDTQLTHIAQAHKDDNVSCARDLRGSRHNFSLLGEFEEEYERLVASYEALVGTKSDGKIAAPADLPSHVDYRPRHLSVACQTEERHGLDTSTASIDMIDGHFEHGPPEYKQLFTQIFDILRRSVVYESDSSNATITN